VSIPAAYRYLHEAIDMIAAAHAPEIHTVLARAHDEGWAFVCLDGRLCPPPHLRHPQSRATTSAASASTTRTAGTSRSSAARLVSRCDQPGRTRLHHDITATRRHALPALYPSAAAGLQTLTDKSYTGAGIEVMVLHPRPSRSRQCGWYAEAYSDPREWTFAWS